LAAAGVGEADCLVLVECCVNLRARELIDLAALAQGARHRCAQVAAALLVRLLVGSCDQLVVVHDRVPHGQLHLGEEREDASELGLGDEALEHGELRAVAHAGGHGVAVQHARGQFVPGRPGVPERVRAALVCLPQIAVLGTDVPLHRFADDEVADLLELGVSVADSAELGLDQPWAGFLDQFEETQVLDAGHLDDFCDPVADPAFMQRTPEPTTGECEYRRVLGALEVLEAVAVAAGARGRPRVNPGDDGGGQHDVRRVAVLECSCKPADVRDHAAAHDEHGFVARHTVVLELDQYLLHVGDVLVNLVPVVHELDALDAEVLEVRVELRTLVLDHLVAHDGHAAAQGLVQVRQQVVGRLKDIVGDFDGGSQRGRHDCFNGLRVLGGQGQAVAVALDAGRLDRVRVDRLEVDIVLNLDCLVGQCTVCL